MRLEEKYDRKGLPLVRLSHMTNLEPFLGFYWKKEALSLVDSSKLNPVHQAVPSFIIANLQSPIQHFD